MPPTLSNREVAALFHEMADMLEIKGENAFRVRAWRRVAQALEHLPEHVGALLEAGTLAKMAGFGEGALSRVRQILATGECEEHALLRAEVGEDLLALLRIEGMGPKTVQLVHTQLGISSLAELEAAARQGRLAALPRMGEKSQAKILAAIEAHRRRAGRTPLGVALPLGLALCEMLRQEPAVLDAELAGSARRRQETIGDLDILVAAEEPAPVMERFINLPQVHEVLLRGETKCAVRLGRGLQVDLRVVAPQSFGAALHYFTGSKLHNIAVRDRGKRRGLRINEYGVFEEASGTRLGGRTEEEIFSAVGLPFIPPELREDQGELAAAESATLPQLVCEQDLHGDLHMHTVATDGTASAYEMAEAALALGYEYIAITDHSQALSVAHGLDAAQLLEQITLLRQLEDRLGRIRLLAGIEVDILPDGSLDLPLDVLRQLDWVIASIHSRFSLPEPQGTARLIRAMESGVVDCLGHPSGRLLGQRDGYAVNLDEVIRAAQRLGVALELNASPDRLDLDAVHCRQARELGVPVVINTDAHAPEELGLRRFGIYTARRGWLEPRHVLNTRKVHEIEERRRARLGAR